MKLDTSNSLMMLILMVLLSIGCTRSDIYKAMASSIQGENVTVTQNNTYQFTYSGHYWQPLGGREKAIVMLYDSDAFLQTDKQFMTLDDETALVIESSDGEYDCSLLTKESLNYTQLDTRLERIGGKEWCIAEGYKTDPDEYFFTPVIQCPTQYVVLAMIGSDTKKAEDKKELYSILESFKCLK